MATVNCARNFGIDRELGGLAPGKLADILVVDDLKRFKPRLVIVGGRVVAGEGKIDIEFSDPSYPSHFLNSIKVSRSLSPSDFRTHQMEEAM
jgi:adenine deaminase